MKNCCEKCDVGTIPNPECDNPSCPCHQENNPSMEKDRKFLRQFMKWCGNPGGCEGCKVDEDAVVEYFQKKLTAQREEIKKKIEGMKHELLPVDNSEEGMGDWVNYEIVLFNQAIDAVLEAISR